MKLATARKDRVEVEPANLDRSTRPHEDRRAILRQIQSQTPLASQQQPSWSKNAGNNGLGRRLKFLLCSPAPEYTSSGTST